MLIPCHLQSLLTLLTAWAASGKARHESGLAGRKVWWPLLVSWHSLWGLLAYKGYSGHGWRNCNEWSLGPFWQGTEIDVFHGPVVGHKLDPVWLIYTVNDWVARQGGPLWGGGVFFFSHEVFIYSGMG